jgi:hypothetical protein
MPREGGNSSLIGHLYKHHNAHIRKILKSKFGLLPRTQNDVSKLTTVLKNFCSVFSHPTLVVANVLVIWKLNPSFFVIVTDSLPTNGTQTELCYICCILHVLDFYLIFF